MLNPMTSYKYQTIVEKVRKRIEAEHLEPGAQLPGEKTLAAELRVNHLTLRRALTHLEQEGIVHRIPSRGSFVGPAPAVRTRPALIGVLFPDNDPFYLGLFAALEQRMGQSGFLPAVRLSRRQASEERRDLDDFLNMGVSGIIAAPCPGTEARYRELSVPVLFFDTYLPGVDVTRIVTDDHCGIEYAVDYLAGLGHRRIAFIGGEGDTTSAIRRSAFLESVEHRGIHLDPGFLMCREYSREWGFNAARELLAQVDPPTAILCGSDVIAAGVLRHVHRTDLRVPRDLSIVGFGNLDLAEDLQLTTIDQSIKTFAESLWSTMRLLLEGRTQPLETIIPVRLVVRASSAPPVPPGANRNQTS